MGGPQPVRKTSRQTGPGDELAGDQKKPTSQTGLGQIAAGGALTRGGGNPKVEIRILYARPTNDQFPGFGGDYGEVRYWRNAGGTPVPKFEPAVLLGSLRARCAPSIADWDGDGRPDVIAARAGAVSLWRNVGQRGNARFEASSLALPPFPPGGVNVAVVDFNGDGDADVLATTTHGYTLFLERSFLAHGYAEARRVR